MEKIKITNPCQFEKLVEELEKNPSLAKGFRRGTVPTNFKEQWEAIANTLNSLGPPSRTGDGWQKIWRDLKFKVKKKMATNKAECRATGGGIFKQVVLSPLEEAVANLLQFQKQISPKGMVLGVPLEENADLFSLKSAQTEQTPTITNKATPTSSASPLSITTPLPLTGSAPSTSTAPLTSTAPSTSSAPSTSTAPSANHLKSSTKKKTENVLQRNELLERHSKEQAKILREISNSNLSIKRSLRDIKDISDKRLQLEVQRSKREEESHLIEMEIKRIDLKIKQKKLQLLNEN